MKPGWVNVYEHVEGYSEYGSVFPDRETADDYQRFVTAGCGVRCVYRIRIVEVHSEPIWKRKGYASPESYEAWRYAAAVRI